MTSSGCLELVNKAVISNFPHLHKAKSLVLKQTRGLKPRFHHLAALYTGQSLNLAYLTYSATEGVRVQAKECSNCLEQGLILLYPAQVLASSPGSN